MAKRDGIIGRTVWCQDPQGHRKKKAPEYSRVTRSRLQSESPGVGFQLGVAINRNQGTVRKPFSEQVLTKRQNLGETALPSFGKSGTGACSGVCRVWRSKRGRVSEIEMLGHRLSREDGQRPVRQE